MKLQHLKTLRTIVKYRKMKENMKSTELSAINSKIVDNDKQQQLISNSFDKYTISTTMDSNSIVTTIHYYQKQSHELRQSKERSKLLVANAQQLLTEFQGLYIERKVAENILEDRLGRQKQSAVRKSVRLQDELGSVVRR